jgi:hypothetical protein
VLLVDFPAHGRAVNTDQYGATLKSFHQDKTSGLHSDSVILPMKTTDRPTSQHGTSFSELVVTVRFGNSGQSPTQSELDTLRFSSLPALKQHLKGHSFTGVEHLKRACVQ